MVFSSLAQNVGINNTGAAAHTTAMLDVASTTKGLLVLRMTSAQRNAIVAPALGLLVYDTEVRTLYHYHPSGGGWNALGNAGDPFNLPFAGATSQVIPAFKITNSGNGPAISGITTNEFGVAVQASNTTPYGYSMNCCLYLISTWCSHCPIH